MNRFTLRISDPLIDRKFREMRYETVFLPFVLQWSAEVIFRIYLLSLRVTNVTDWDLV